MYRLKEIRIRENVSDEDAFKKALKRDRIPESLIKSWRIFKKSIDARKKFDVCVVYTFEIDFISVYTFNSLNQRIKEKIVEVKEIPSPEIRVSRLSEYRPIIIGAGPAGLFVALTLSQNGFKPIESGLFGSIIV